jgi:hypothetical protein
MRLLVTFPNVDHAPDHAHRGSHQNVIAHLIASEVLAGATRGRRLVERCIRGGGYRRILERNLVSSRHP